tara:strand:- start:198 stop:545 length:348 start_codon:yes stop_codon:yes gene_type:complete
MAEKKLQADSMFNEFDTDGDGIVSDAELMAAERQAELRAKIERWRNEDALQDRQRAIAMVAMVSSIAVIAWLLSPYVTIERMSAAQGFVNTFLVAQTGIVVGFMGASAWSKKKAE